MLENTIYRRPNPVLCSRFLHSKNIIHRDIKPGNLLLGTNGAIRLSDFGTCRRILADEVNEQTNRVIGTPPYMPWEAIQGKVCLMSDIWAVGCTACEMATGQTPWSHLHAQPAPLLYHIGNNPDAKPKVAAHLSASCRDFIHCTFQTNPQDRPPAHLLLQHAFFTCAAMEATKDVQVCKGSQCVAEQAQNSTQPEEGGRPAPPPLPLLIILMRRPVLSP